MGFEVVISSLRPQPFNPAAGGVRVARVDLPSPYDVDDFADLGREQGSYPRPARTLIPENGKTFNGARGELLKKKSLKKNRNKLSGTIDFLGTKSHLGSTMNRNQSFLAKGHCKKNKAAVCATRVSETKKKWHRRPKREYNRDDSRQWPVVLVHF